jgi:Tol biopolymer transport system component
VAFDRGLDTDIFLFDIERGLTSKLVSTTAADFAPVWSADERTIAFASSRDPAGNVGPQNTSGGHLYERTVGVVGEDTLLLKTDAGKIPTDWSRDGRYVAYTSRNDVWAVPMRASGDAQPVRVTDTPFVESGGRFSPDGSLIAYQSNESGGRPDVYIQTFPGRGARQQVSVGCGSQPRWAPTGTELFYVAPDLTLMSVSINADGGELNARSPVPLFQSLAFQRDSEYDVSSDGRFLLKLPGEEQRAASITVIVNWHEELKRRLPTN